jgi:enediyne biosynthesis protein E4
MFQDVAQEAGLTWRHTNGPVDGGMIVETTGGGCAFVDYDRDGWLDIVLLSCGDIKKQGTADDPRIGLFRNRGNGKFDDVTRGSGLDVPLGYCQAVSVADYDNDGYSDLFIAAYGGCKLFRNRGASDSAKSGPQFEDVTKVAGVGDTDQGVRYSSAAAWGDYDSDGWLDLVIVRYVIWSPETDKKCPAPDGSVNYCGPNVYPPDVSRLFHNEGNGRFKDVSKSAGIDNVVGRGLGAAWMDFNGDGRLDLYVANDHDPNRLYRNDGKGQFTEVAAEVGAAYAADGMAASGMGVAIGDYERSGRESIVVTNLNGEAFSLFRGEEGGNFTYATDLAGLRVLTAPYAGWGTAFADLDRDGWQDLIVATGHANPLIERIGSSDVTYKQRMVVCRNTGSGQFEDMSDRAGAVNDLYSRRGMAVGDYDRDGRLDVLCINRNDRPSLYRNGSTDSNHWLRLSLTGNKSNRDGAGAKVRVTSGGAKQLAMSRLSSSYASSCDKSLFFGLGPNMKVEKIEIVWPSGKRQAVGDLEADGWYEITEGGGCVRNQ